MTTISTCADPGCDEDFPCESCTATWLAATDPTALDSAVWRGVIRTANEGVITDRQRPTGNGTGHGGARRDNGASDKQRAFIARLASERGQTIDTEGMSKADASATIERLLATPATEVKPRWKKVDGQWGVNAPGSATGDTVTVHKANGDTAEVTLGERLTGDIFAPAKGAPATAGKATASVVDAPGMYATADDRIVKVQESAAGRLYGKVLDESGKFEYSPGAVRDITRKLTLEEAAEYGKLTGICCCCGRTLTNEDSIAAGIGPICASKF